MKTIIKIIALTIFAHSLGCGIIVRDIKKHDGYQHVMQRLEATKDNFDNKLNDFKVYLADKDEVLRDYLFTHTPGKPAQKGANGERGEQGEAGASGEPCTIKAIEGGAEVTCNGSVVAILDGVDGDDGSDGSDGSDGASGEDGESCSVKLEPVCPGNKPSTKKVKLSISCGNASAVTKLNSADVFPCI